jgi:hypothetical protein
LGITAPRAIAVLRLELNSTWGLPENQPWDIYRHYPDPAKLQADRNGFGSTASISLRPFDVLLLEVVPAGQAPTLDRQFPVQPMASGFAEASRPVEISISASSEKDSSTVSLTVRGNIPPARNGGTLVASEAGKQLTIQSCRIAGKNVPCSQPPRDASWQVWRMSVEPVDQARDFEMVATSTLSEEDAKRRCRVFFIPK